MHLATKADKPCIVWEADDPAQHASLSYREGFHGTCRIANALKATGVAKGDFVTVYMRAAVCVPRRARLVDEQSPQLGWQLRA